MSTPQLVTRRIINDDQADALRRFWAAVDQAGGPSQLPCTWNPDGWFAEGGADRLIAITGCMTCPASRECDELAANEHWGIWSAQPRDHKPAPIPCAHCGQGFHRKHHSALYCSPTCRALGRREGQQAYEERKKQR